MALMGGIHDFVSVSSSELGRILSISQQSASKRILELLELGLLTRDLGARSQRIKITRTGIDSLMKEYADFKRIFELKDQLAIRGTVTTGLGEGQYYVQQKGYLDQFEKKLWFLPYEGTLNLRIESADLVKLNILESSEGILVDGFESEGRSFGEVRCFSAKIRGVECAVIMPVRSHHSNVLEVISKHHLRSTIGLEDGDLVELIVYL
ncbi:MAG: DUF120 domain-containing protein [Methanomassiliicoccales archaeon]|nr:MAG: DUF120 domain-containing protein [Methanomassiliicoccales archaeon]